MKRLVVLYGVATRCHHAHARHKQLYKLAWLNNHTMVYYIMTSKTVQLVSDAVNSGSSLNHQTDLPCLSCVSMTLFMLFEEICTLSTGYVGHSDHVQHVTCVKPLMLLLRINQPHPPPAYSSLSVEFHMLIQRHGECCSS